MGQILSFLLSTIRKHLDSSGHHEDEDDSSPSKQQLLSDDNDIESSLKLHQNYASTSTCRIHIVEDNNNVALGVENWEESESESEEEEEELGSSSAASEIIIVWVGHYCSSHKILLVGEGDFSFSASLAVAFASATNMVATSLDSRGFLLRNYRMAMLNIHALRSRGCSVVHGVDATEMATHSLLRGIKFDRIIFNFPHAGFCPGEPPYSEIRRHQLLMRLFFENGKEMIEEGGGEIHVTHKSNGFFLGWNLEGVASYAGLTLVGEVPFNFRDYPGYRTKYGFGGDNNFNSHPSKTYIFRLLPPPPSPSQSNWNWCM